MDAAEGVGLAFVFGELEVGDVDRDSRSVLLVRVSEVSVGSGVVEVGVVDVGVDVGVVDEVLDDVGVSDVQGA